MKNIPPLTWEVDGKASLFGCFICVLLFSSHNGPLSQWFITQVVGLQSLRSTVPQLHLFCFVACILTRELFSRKILFRRVPAGPFSHLSAQVHWRNSGIGERLCPAAPQPQELQEVANGSGAFTACVGCIQPSLAMLASCKQPFYSPFFLNYLRKRKG